MKWGQNQLQCDMCLFLDVVFLTVLMKVTSLEEVKENFPCLELLSLQTGHSHVVLLLFGMHFRFMHSKGKNLPVWQLELWHSTCLSVVFGFCLHKLTESNFKTSAWGVIFFPLAFLNSGLVDLMWFYWASPGFWQGYRDSVSQLLRSRNGQTITPGTSCPKIYK